LKHKSRYLEENVKVFEPIGQEINKTPFTRCPYKKFELDNDAEICQQYQFPPSKTYIVRRDNNKYYYKKEIVRPTERKHGFSGN